VTAFLLITLALGVWVLSLYLKPFGACRRCHGKRMVMAGSKKRPRPVTCPRCKGIGRAQRPASRIVHQLARRVRRYRQHQATLAERTASHADRNL
jgi:hypothetical protein